MALQQKLDLKIDSLCGWLQSRTDQPDGPSGSVGGELQNLQSLVLSFCKGGCCVDADSSSPEIANLTSGNQRSWF